MRSGSGVRHLIVAHYHLRPGGVRRVIELTLPAIVEALPDLESVRFLVGEAPDTAWIQALEIRLSDAPPLSVEIAPACGYLSEQSAGADEIRDFIRATLNGMNASADGTVIWAHNLGLARNPIFAAELARVAAGSGVRLVSHHHDFWFDNRWARWPEFERFGFADADAVAEAVFSANANVVFATINRFDLSGITAAAPGHSVWLPNPLGERSGVDPVEIEKACAWLDDLTGPNRPVWLAPCRFLRRKNLAEAALLRGWLFPDAALVSTAAASSADEIAAFEALAGCVSRAHLPVWLAAVARSPMPPPGIEALMAAASGVLVSSIQEGFGLPYLEAATARRPLVARELPMVFPDLQDLGLSLQHTYPEVWIDPDLIDSDGESHRLNARWQTMREKLPAFARKLLADHPPIGPKESEPGWAFARLTLESRLALLELPPARVASACLPLNPALQRIAPQPTPDPLSPEIGERLSIRRYAEDLVDSLDRCAPMTADAARRAQSHMLESRLAGSLAFPALWAS